MGDGKGRTRNPAMEELIGRKVKVNAHTDMGLVGLEGIIIDETRNTITVTGPNGRTMVSKRGAILSLDANGSGAIALKGDHLLFRPEDRIKRCGKVQSGSQEEEYNTDDH